jgi:hypothetical protein
MDEAIGRRDEISTNRLTPRLGRWHTPFDHQAAGVIERIDINLPMKRPSDRQHMAENLNWLITAALAFSDGRVTRAAIASAAGMADGDGTSKRLYNYKARLN